MINKNYTNDEFKQLVALYSEDVPISEISAILGRSQRSIIAKLVKEGLYVTAEQPLRTKRLTKLDLIFEMSACLELDPKSLQSLISAKYEELALLHKAITTRNKPSLEDYTHSDFATL